MVDKGSNFSSARKKVAVRLFDNDPGPHKPSILSNRDKKHMMTEPSQKDSHQVLVKELQKLETKSSS
jgi:hypothetical protein